MKVIFFAISFFGAVIFAPNADQGLAEGWAIHPFSVFATIFVVTGIWLLDEAKSL